MSNLSNGESNNDTPLKMSRFGTRLVPRRSSANIEQQIKKQVPPQLTSKTNEAQTTKRLKRAIISEAQKNKDLNVICVKKN